MDGLEESSARARLSQSQCRVGWSPRISRTPLGFEISAPFAFSDTDGRRAYYDQVPIARSTSRPDGLWNTRRSNSGTTASRWSKMSAWIAS